MSVQILVAIILAMTMFISMWLTRVYWREEVDALAFNLRKAWDAWRAGGHLIDVRSEDYEGLDARAEAEELYAVVAVLAAQRGGTVTVSVQELIMAHGYDMKVTSDMIGNYTIELIDAPVAKEVDADED